MLWRYFTDLFFSRFFGFRFQCSGFKFRGSGVLKFLNFSTCIYLGLTPACRGVARQSEDGKPETTYSDFRFTLFEHSSIPFLQQGITMPTANIGDIQIYYEEHGQGPPLIMILGLGQDIPTWSFQTSELSENFRLIVLDNRDSGKSTRCSQNYTTETMAHDILGLMDYLGIDRTHLLGTSMGGMIAQHVALMAPERLNSLMLASTTSWGEA